MNKTFTLFTKNFIGPTPGAKHYARKKGRPLEGYGEIKIESLGDDWADFLQITNDADSECEACIDINKARNCISEIQKMIGARNDAGISFAKTRNKYHVEVNVCGKKQFVGQFDDKKDAVNAKEKFLIEFMDLVRDRADISEPLERGVSHETRDVTEIMARVYRDHADEVYQR